MPNNVFHARRALSRYGWLPSVKTASQTPVELSELSCPECGSEGLMQADNDFTVTITCADCSHSIELAHRDVVADSGGRHE